MANGEWLIVNGLIMQLMNLGDQLKDVRRKKGVSLDKAAKDLKIAFKYLEAIEENDFCGLPSADDFKNILRVYCAYLNLDFSRCFKLANKSANNIWVGSKCIEKKYFLMWPNFIRKSIAGAVVVLILIFLAVSIEKIFSAPPLEIYEPKDGLITQDRQIDIIGKSKREVEIIINNRNVLVDGDGNFNTSVDLQNGLNLIKITAKKRYGRPQEVDLRVLLEEPDEITN